MLGKKLDSVYKLRRTEREILRALQRDGRMSNVELAERVGLSESPCLRRVRALEEAGVIRGYTATVDRRRIGLDVMAYIQVNLDQRSESDTQKFLDAVGREDRIVECYAMSGTYDFLLKVVAHTIDEFSDLTMRRILRYPGVKDLSSAFALEEIKHSRALPL